MGAHFTCHMMEMMHESLWTCIKTKNIHVFQWAYLNTRHALQKLVTYVGSDGVLGVYVYGVVTHCLL